MWRLGEILKALETLWDRCLCVWHLCISCGIPSSMQERLQAGTYGLVNRLPNPEAIMQLTNCRLPCRQL